MAMEEHKSCLCVDPDSINVTLDVDVRLRRELQEREEEKLSREIRRLFQHNSTLSSKASILTPKHYSHGSSHT